MQQVKKPVLLVILDGFGIRENSDFNAINQAKKPNIDNFMKNYSYGQIDASGVNVGLPAGQFGNSEVGHLNIGAGRIVRQEISKIDYAIETGEFFKNTNLIKLITNSSGNLHIMGLLSDGGVHAHQNHIYALIKLASNYPHIKKIYVHAFLDGRDTPPQSAIRFIEALEEQLKNYPKASLATICGRYYAMDRDKRFERIQLAFDAITKGIGNTSFRSPIEAITQSYNDNVLDEFVLPCVFNNYTGSQPEDGFIFANFRSDRALQLSQALTQVNFDSFARTIVVDNQHFLSMTQYDNQLDCLVAFAPATIHNTLGEYISNLGLKQLRIAETEKFPHVTYFFNGGEHLTFAGENRILINSPKDVATYDQKPEMSLPELSDKLCLALDSQQYDLVISNFANGDMVGHTGNFAASVKAVEALDTNLAKVVASALKNNYAVIVIADHGNCEEMFDYTSKQPHTQHTTNLVPFIYIGDTKPAIISGGSLQDVAPTILKLMGLTKPLEMTGKSLIEE